MLNFENMLFVVTNKYIKELFYAKTSNIKRLILTFLQLARLLQNKFHLNSFKLINDFAV